MADNINNDQNEFEQQFEFDDETTQTSDQYELDDNEFELDDNEFESDLDEFETGDDINTETKDNDEFQTDEESDYLSELGEDNELNDLFEDTPDIRYERRLYEIFSNGYDNEFEFENDFNQAMHEMERDFFWKKIKKWGRKLAPIARLALKSIPGGGNIMDTLKQLTKDPRGLLKTLAMKFGPQALNAVVPGSGIALGAVLGNGETDNAATEAARETVELARESYSNFSDEISRTHFNKNLPAVRARLNDIARNAFKRAQANIRLRSKNRRYRRVNRRVRNVRNGMYKVVTIVYKRVQ